MKPLHNSTGYYNQWGDQISANAYHALYAATIRQQVGRYMAMAYIIKQNVPLSLYRLAQQLVNENKKHLTH